MVATGCGQGSDPIIGVTPFELPNARLTVTLGRAGALGILASGEMRHEHEGRSHRRFAGRGECPWAVHAAPKKPRSKPRLSCSPTPRPGRRRSSAVGSARGGERSDRSTSRSRTRRRWIERVHAVGLRTEPALCTAGKQGAAAG